MKHSFDSVGSLAASLAAGPWGVQILRTAQQPEQLLELYEMENCPFCRVVRNVLTELDLDARIFPCPKGGERFRPEVRARGGKELFPYLHDPNTGARLYESADIVAYLYETYAGGGAPSHAAIKALRTSPSMAASALRVGHGIKARPGRLPEHALELYSFESSPFSRMVRERLCELEIPYILRNCGRNQPVEWIVIPALRERLAPDYAPTQRNRKALQERTGRVQVPYLVDPNTGTEMFESARILRYLSTNYGPR